MDTLSSDARLPLYQRLHYHFAQQTAVNQLRPGETIPTQATPTPEYQLPPGAARKAVNAQVNEGVLERQQ